jgi:pilus assembly protein CpaB
MKPKTMLLMVVAIGCGLAASYMTSKLLAERNAAPAEEEKVPVLVARIKVPAWVSLKDPEKYFERKDVPVSIAPKKGLKEFKDVKDQRLIQALSEGEYVLEDKLVNVEQAGLIAKLPAGMRAIALKVNAVSLSGGFVLPGYRVDVVSTTRGGGADSTARIILQNMLVLAVDTVSNRDNQMTSMLGSTVTLAATPEEAQRLALAEATGELRLTLRTPEDTKIVHLPGSKMEDLGKPVRDASALREEDASAVVSAPPVPPLPPLPKEAPPPLTLTQKPPEKPAEQGPPAQTHTMLLVSGDYTQKEVFTLDPVAKVWMRTSGTEEAPPRRPAPPAAATANGTDGNGVPPVQEPSAGGNPHGRSR